MNHFIVMEGNTYQEGDKGIIWSPQKDKAGNVPPSWKRMTEVKEGDRIFHYVRGNMIAVSLVKEGCIEAKKPPIFQNIDHWNDDGYLVNIDYYELEIPVNIRENFKRISPLLPIKHSPFRENAAGNKGCLYPCNEELTLTLLELIKESNFLQMNDEQLEFVINDIQVIEHHPLIPIIAETESEVETKIRADQENIILKMLSLWDGKCAICGIELLELLKMSPSKPWKDSTSLEKNNPYNGLLLCCNHDVLYQQGLITLDGQGRLQIASIIPEYYYGKYSLRLDKKIKIHPENKSYFNWHKRNIFRGSL